MAELFGFIALFFGMWAHSQKIPNKSLLCLSISALFWTLHFLLLGQVAYMVLAMNCIRNFLSIFLNQVYLKILLLGSLIGNLSLIILVAADEPIDYLPIISVIFFTLGILNKQNPKTYRSLLLISELNWLLYGLLVSSVSFSLAAFVMISALMVSIYRYDIVTVKRHKISHEKKFLVQN